MAADTNEPTWQPLSRLGLIAALIDEGLRGSREQYALLLEAKHRPHVLDDETIERTVAVYTDARADVDLYDAQLRRWASQHPSPGQRREIDRLSLQLADLHEAVDNILGLADELAGVTIEAVLAKSDLEVGLEALFGGRILDPRTPEPSVASRRASPRTRPPALPAGVSLAALADPGVMGWVILHAHLGEVGRILLADAETGGCRMEAEVVGPPGDPAFDLRCAVVEDVVACLDRITGGQV